MMAVFCHHLYNALIIMYSLSSPSRKRDQHHGNMYWRNYIIYSIFMQVSKYRNYREENEDDYGNMYGRTDYMEREDGDLSWFNSGVRVGVGIGLSICLGIGVGVGLLVRTYQATSRTLKRQLM